MNAAMKTVCDFYDMARIHGHGADGWCPCEGEIRAYYILIMIQYHILCADIHYPLSNRHYPLSNLIRPGGPSD